MKYWIAFLCLISLAILNAENTPASANTSDGKTVYVPIANPIPMDDEARIQQEDQNQTRRGGKT